MISNHRQLASDYIGQALALLALPDSWDDAGGRAFSQEHITTALTLATAALAANFGLPVLSPGPGQTLDLHWKTEPYELLANLKSDGSGTFFGDNYGVNEQQGELTPTNLLAALTALNTHESALRDF